MGKEAKASFCLFLSIVGIKMPRLHLSCMSAAAQIECADAKARFCLRKYYFYYIQNFTFYILPFTFLRGRLGADITSRASRMRRTAEEERRHSPKRQAPRLGADITSRTSRKARGGRGAQAFPEAAGSARGRRHARQNAPSLLSQIYKTP